MNKTRKLRYVAILAGVLVSTLALPVLADGDTPMWVHRIRLAYVGRNCSCPDRMVAMVHIRDATKAMVADAEVTVEWTVPKPDGTVAVVEQTAVTAFQGIAEFAVPAAQAGEYKLCVVSVTEAEREYRPLSDREECPTIRAY